MKREVFFVLAIFTYALLALGFSWKYFNHAYVASAQAPRVLTAIDYKFVATDGSPDPNVVFEIANKARNDYGSSSLITSEKLGAIATQRAADMANRHYYAHKSPDGKYYYDYFGEYGVKTDYSCENLDLVFAPSPDVAINEWLASTKGHRNCLIRSDLVSAGYATTKLSLIDYFGQPTTAYLIVAIHSTQLK